MSSLNQSLNAGLELDDEIFENAGSLESSTDNDTDIKGIPASEFSDTVFDKPILGEVPELKDNVAITTIVNGSEDLHDLKKDILNAGGASKRFALEAEKLIPGFINDEKPISFYTEFPSKTNYKLVLEAIEAEQKSLVSKVWDLIIKLFKSSIEWLEEFASKVKSLISDSDIAKKFYSDSQTLNILEKIQDNVEDPDKTANEAEVRIRSKYARKDISTSLKVCSQQIRQFYDSINKDTSICAIISKDPMVETLIKIGIDADNIIDEYGVVNKDWLEKALLDRNNRKRNVYHALSQIYGPAVKRNIPAFETYQAKVQLSLDQQSGKYTPKNMPLKQLCVIFSDTFKMYDAKNYGGVIDKAVLKLKKLRESIQFYSNAPWPTASSNDESSTAVTDVVGSLYRELRALMLLLNTSSKIFYSWSFVFSRLSAIQNHYNRSIYQDISTLPDNDKNTLKEYFGLKAV